MADLLIIWGRTITNEHNVSNYGIKNIYNLIRLMDHTTNGHHLTHLMDHTKKSINEVFFFFSFFNNYRVTFALISLSED